MFGAELTIVGLVLGVDILQKVLASIVSLVGSIVRKGNLPDPQGERFEIGALLLGLFNKPVQIGGSE